MTRPTALQIEATMLSVLMAAAIVSLLSGMAEMFRSLF
jgi:hypothetical protein